MSSKHIYPAFAYTSSLFAYLLLSAYGPDYGPAGLLTLIGRFIFQTSAGFFAAVLAISAYGNPTTPNPLLSAVMFFFFLTVHLLPWSSLRAYVLALVAISITLLAVSS